MKIPYLCNCPGKIRNLAIKTKRNHTSGRNLSCYGLPFAFCLLLIVSVSFLTNVSYGQVGIISFTANTSTTGSTKAYNGPGCGIGAQSEYFPSSNNNFHYNFGAGTGLPYNLLSVNGYIAGSTSYAVVANIITSVVMRRVDNAQATGTRDILFFAGTRNPDVTTSGQTNTNFQMKLSAAYTPDMGTAFFQNNLLIGTDNIFSNQGNGNGNNNNIERVDVLVAGGFKVIDGLTSGFPVLERGVYGQHDAFKVAVITALDASGNPSAYTKVISVTTANYNNTNGQNPVADGTYKYFLFKRDGTNDLQVDQHITNQGIGGVALRFADFGIANGTKIYGYSILANDFNSTLGSDVINYTNSAHFPTNTDETLGGLDLLAVIGIGFQTNVLPVEMTSFTANEKNGKSELEWTTVTETNSQGFSVERSANGKDWKEIGFVSSKSTKGNSNQELDYTYYDENPISGLNYYRLRQLDINDHEKISQVRIVSMAADHTRITIFPNPVVDNVFVHGIEVGTKLLLTDTKGSIIYKNLATQSDVTIPADKLMPGVYFLQISNSGALIKTLKVIKKE